MGAGIPVPSVFGLSKLSKIFKLFYWPKVVVTSELSGETTTMIRISIIYLLLVSLATPLNSGATAWMSLHMGAHGESRALPNDVVSTGHHASQYDAHRLAGHPDPTEPPPHNHDPQDNGHNEADCEAQCLACANHSSSSAPLSPFCESRNKTRDDASFLAQPLARSADLLLRPPILA